MKADELDLAPACLKVALAFEAVFPDAVFTSGRRNLADQARAMAQNVAKNPRWIEQTYTPSEVSKACQEYVEGATVGGSIAGGLLAVMKGFTDEQLSHLSKHLGGMAFDVEPNENQNQKSWLYARAAQVKGKFLEREGGLVRWHFEIDV